MGAGRRSGAQERQQLGVEGLGVGDVEPVGCVADEHECAAVDGVGGAPVADLEPHDGVGVAMDDQGRDGERREVAAEVGLRERRRAIEGAPR